MWIALNLLNVHLKVLNKPRNLLFVYSQHQYKTSLFPTNKPLKHSNELGIAQLDTYSRTKDINKLSCAVTM